jgi:hypothetical protein
MGKSRANSKHKDKQPKIAQNAPVTLSKNQWSDWSNFVLAAAAVTSTVLYVWRKMEAGRIDRAGKTAPSAVDMQADPDIFSSDTARSMTDQLASNWDKADKVDDASLSGQDNPVH